MGVIKVVWGCEILRAFWEKIGGGGNVVSKFIKKGNLPKSLRTTALIIRRDMSKLNKSFSGNLGQIDYKNLTEFIHFRKGLTKVFWNTYSSKLKVGPQKEFSKVAMTNACRDQLYRVQACPISWFYVICFPPSFHRWFSQRRQNTTYLTLKNRPWKERGQQTTQNHERG